MTLWRRLALGGVGGGALTTEHLPIQRGEAVGCFWVEQAEKLQLVDVEVADRLYRGKLSQHLKIRGNNGDENVKDLFVYTVKLIVVVF